MSIKFLSGIKRPKGWAKRRTNMLVRKQKKLVEAMKRQHWHLSDALKAQWSWPKGYPVLVFEQHSVVYEKGVDVYEADPNSYLYIHVRTIWMSVDLDGKILKTFLQPMKRLENPTKEDDNNG